MVNVTDENFLLKLKNSYSSFLEKESVFDEEVDKWFLMPSFMPTLSIIVVYLLFILKIGPAYMKNREPYKLKFIMLCYNIFQTLYNGYFVFWLFSTPKALHQQWNSSCHLPEKSQNVDMILELNKALWYFFISKVIDLLDTVFFVLRKKQSQVTFLHIYHHVNMVITCWVYIRFVKDEQGVFPGTLNAFIHTIMYFYYFLAALGPQMQPYLWWKKYLTKLQIIQFLLIVVWYSGHIFFNCRVSKLFTYYIMVNTVLFIYLFMTFYIKTYKKKSKTEKTN